VSFEGGLVSLKFVVKLCFEMSTKTCIISCTIECMVLNFGWSEIDIPVEKHRARELHRIVASLCEKTSETNMPKGTCSENKLDVSKA
jgi:hypothetical protein